jgi:hypothetical protein
MSTNKVLPIAAALFCLYAAVALSGAAGSKAAVVKHTFVVSRNAFCLGNPDFIYFSKYRRIL